MNDIEINNKKYIKNTNSEALLTELLIRWNIKHVGYLLKGTVYR